MNMLAKKLLPEDVSHLHLDDSGKLSIGRSGGLVEFGFTYMDVAFAANTRLIESGPVVQISGEVAPLPYSAEGVAVRRSAMAIINASQSLGHTRFAISKHKMIICVGKAPIEQPWGPVDLISAAATIILEIRPCLQMLAEILPAWPARRQSHVT
ncbi:hypothetical protein A8950_3141 [Dongia mobilis]|uniref:Uncharacterized protein n=1 Tax=Dongia mobilis TaxID=578943 RepID=A0A4R6WJZ5_9PROT|nr:hypothetical protein [Dongia mobilis]TDQ80606.1 hypothetical protein A8950_3141 [Dongia mobilis]